MVVNPSDANALNGLGELSLGNELTGDLGSSPFEGLRDALQRATASMAEQELAAINGSDGSNPMEIDPSDLFGELNLEDPLASEGEANTLPVTTGIDSLTGRQYQARQGQRADLVGQLQAVNLPDTIVPGDDGRVTLRLSNQGNKDTYKKSAVRIFALSNDNPNAVPVLIGEKTLNLNLKTGRSKHYAVGIDTPGNLEPGNYVIYAEIDANNRVRESNEGNNLVVINPNQQVSWQFGDLGDRRNVKLDVQNSRGQTVRFELQGRGYGEIIGGGDFSQIILHGTNRASTLKIRSIGGNHESSVGEIIVNGSLNKIDARRTDLRNGINVSGTVREIKLDDVIGPQTIEIANGDGFRSKTKIDLDRVADLSLVSNSRISTLSATEWLNRDGQADSIIAPSINQLRITGQSNRRGDFAADLNLGSARRNAIHDVRIAGQASGQWQLEGGIRNLLRVGSTTNSWSANIDGRVNNITVDNNLAGTLSISEAIRGRLLVRNNVRNATVLVGADLGSDGQLGGSGEAADRFGSGRIRRVEVKGRVINSVIGAGLDPVDGIFKNGDDTVVGGRASRINVFNVRGNATANSLFAAGRFRNPPKVRNRVVDPSQDGRFLLGGTPPTGDIDAPEIEASLLNDTGLDDGDRLTAIPTITGTVADASPITQLSARLDNAQSDETLGDDNGFSDVTSALNSEGDFELDLAQLESLNGEALADGAYQLNLRAVDALGNVSGIYELDFTLDTTGPAAPVIDLDSISDSGVSNSDNITNAPVLTFNGIAEANATLQVEVAGVTLEALADETGAWEVTTDALVDGLYEVTATPVDAAGNQGLTSAPLLVTVDTTGPALSLNGLAEGSILTNGARFSGNLDGTGSAVASLVYQIDNNAPVSIPVDAAGNFDQAIDFSGIANGDHVIQIVRADLAGNETTTVLNVTVDLDFSGPVITAALANDTAANGETNADGITADGTISGSVVDDGTIASFAASLDGSATIDVSSALNADGSFSLSQAELEQLAGGNLSDGEHELVLTAQDSFGNAAAPLTLSFVFDATAPDAPTLNLDPNSDSGISNSDGITNISALTLLGEAELDSTIQLFIDGVPFRSLTSTGDWEATTEALADGDHVLTATATDIAGNVSTIATPLNITLDTREPALNLTDLADGAVLEEGATLTGSVDGTGSALAEFTYQFDDGEAIAVTVDEAGNFNQPLDFTDLSPGDHTLSLTRSDVAGNQATTVLTVSFGSVDSDGPSISAELANDSGVSNSDGITNQASISGTVFDESEIIGFQASLNGAAPVNVLPQLNGDGSFSLSREQLEAVYRGALLDGTYRLELIAIDELGNRSTPLALTFVLDTAAPDLVVQTPLVAGEHSSWARLTGGVSDAGSGVAAVTANLDGQGISGVDVTDGRFDQSLQDQPLSNGTHQIVLSAQDVAGNRAEQTIDFEASADFATGPNGSRGWAATSETDGVTDTVILGEQDGFVVQKAIDIELGQAEGARTLSFDLDAAFDSSDNGAAQEDRLVIYLVDPQNPTQTLLDGGEPGSALFALSGETAEFRAGLVRFDGQRVEVDLTSLGDLSQGQLIVQLLNHDGDSGSTVTLSNLSNVVDSEGTSSLLFPTRGNTATPGAALDLDSLSVSEAVELRLSDVRLDVATGQYVADVQVKNDGEALGRNVAVRFSNLPDGVTLTNASGTDAEGNPYINLRNGIRAGGLDKGAISDAIQLVFDNPDLARLDLRAEVLVGGANQAPVFEPVGPLSVTPGSKIEVDLQAIDPDGDAVTFSIQTGGQELPNGKLQGNGTITFTPNPEQLGSYEFTLVATDGALRTEQTVTLDVVADPVTTTRVSGQVLDIDGTPLANMPIQLGEFQGTTDAEGYFTVEVPEGTAFNDIADTLRIFGNQIPGDYTFIAEKLPLVLGHDLYEGVNNVIDRPIYLPQIDLAGVQAEQTTRVIDGRTLSGTEYTSANLAEAAVFVADNSVTDPDGNPFLGQLSITEVPVDRTPAALPEGLLPDLVVTIQPGDMVLTEPAQLTLPNRSGFSAGFEMDLWSISPITGEFEIVGKGRVSADGESVETIEGGIRNSSWHSFSPPPPPPLLLEDPGQNPLNTNHHCPDHSASDELGSQVNLQTGEIIETHNLVSYTSLGAAHELQLTYNSERASSANKQFHFSYPSDIFADERSTNQRVVATFELSQNNFTYQAPGNSEIPGQTAYSLLDDNRGGRVEAAIDYNLSELPSGTYNYRFSSQITTDPLRNIATETAASVTGLSSFTGTINHVNANESASTNGLFGNGWGLAGTKRITVNSDDNGVLLIDGSGTDLAYRFDSETGTYQASPGDFATLVRLPNGRFQRTERNQTIQEFDEQHRLISSTDRNGNITLHIYNDNNQLEKIIDPTGLETQFIYENGLVTKIIDPAARETLLEYDDNQNLIRIIDPDNSQRNWDYNAQNLILSETDKRDSREEITYDEYGLPISAVQKDGSIIQVQSTQSVESNIRDIFDEEGNVIGQSVARTQSVVSSEPFSLYVDQNGNVERASITQAGLEREKSDDIGQQFRVDRNINNQIETHIDGRGNETRFSYDELGNVLQIQDTLTVELDPISDTDIFSTLTPEYDVPDVGSSRSEPAVGFIDLNQDVFLDLVFASDNGISYRAGTGDGNFGASPIELETSFQPDGVIFASADLNGDGFNDLVISSDENGFGFNQVINTLLYSPDNGLVETETTVALDLSAQKNIEFHDLENDGDLDLFIVQTNDGYGSDIDLLIYENDGNGNFAEAQQYTIPDFSGDSISVEDLNGDGSNDILLSSGDPYGGGSNILLSQGDGTFTASAPIQALLFGDVNHDGFIDIIDNDGSSDLDVYLGDASGTFSDTAISTLFPNFFFSSGSQIELADFDGDGNLDVLLSDFRDGIQIAFGEGTGQFGEAITVFSDEVSQVFINDVDDDGDLDIVVGDTKSGFDVQVILNGTPQASVEVSKRFTYDPTFNRVTSYTDELDRQTFYEIDPSNGNLLSKTYVIGELGGDDDLITTYTYTSEGQIDSITDPLGRITDYNYDAIGRIVDLTFAKGTAEEASRLFEYSDLVGNLAAFTDENGNRTEYAYDSLNRLISTTEADPDGAGPLTSPITEYQYDTNGNLIEFKDAEGSITTFTYDALDRMVSMTDANLQTSRYAYDENGNRISTIDFRGNETRYRYDARDRLTQVIDEEGNQFEYFYDNDDNLVRSVDGRGNSSRYIYDSRYRLITSFDAFDETTQYTYDAVGNLTAMVDREGNRTEYLYDDVNRRTRIINAELGEFDFFYDKASNLIRQEDELDQATTFDYDNRNRLVRQTNALFDEIEYAYDDVSNLLSFKDELGRQTTYTYDALNRRTSITDPGLDRTFFSYDRVDNLISATDALSRTTNYQYDKLHRLTVTTNALGDSSTYEYDANSNLIQAQDELGRTSQFSYDRRDLLTASTDALGQTTRTEYDANGNVTAVIDALGHETSYGYDALNRSIRSTDALGQSTLLGYDKVGNLISLQDPNQNTTTVAYDGLYRLVSETNELGQSRTFEYDAASNLTSQTDRNGRQTRFNYDVLNRLDSEQWLDSSGAVIHTLDFEYFADHQLSSVTDEFSSYSYSYDNKGRIDSINNGGTEGVPQVVLNYGYDAVNNLTSVVDSIEGQQAGTETFSYDALNRVTRIEQFGNGVVDKRADFEYDAASQIRSLTRYGDLAGTNLVASTELTFDLDGRLSSLTHSNATEEVAGYQFEYDAADRLTEFNSLLDGVSTYAYNDRNELTSSDHSNQADEAYRYDDNGNRTNDGYQTGTNNLLLTDGQFNYSYDDEGNRTQRIEIATGEVTDYEWDHRNRLVGIETRSSTGELLSSAEYTYDAYNRRIAKTVDSDGDGNGVAQTERFVYDGAHIALVFDGEGDLQQRFLHGPGIDQVLAQEAVPSGEVLWALTDHQGTVRDVVDNAGQVVNHLVYDSFGNITSETNPEVDFRFSYTGREFDEETGQYYYRARYYDATVGQFINEDTIGFAGGDANLNRYVGNSPTNYVDPSGNILKTLGQIGKAAWEGGIEGAKSGGGTGGASGFISGALRGALLETAPGRKLVDTLEYGGKGLVDFWSNPNDVQDAVSGIKPTITSAAEEAQDSYVETYTNPDANPIVRGGAAAGGVVSSLATEENFDTTKTVIEAGLLADAAIQIGLAAPELARRAAAAANSLDDLFKTLSDDFLGLISGKKCFVAGTLILTTTGKKAIEELKPGDWVLSWDEETGEVSERAVTEWFRREAPAIIDIFIGTEKISCTPEHPFWVEGKQWVEASQLKEGSVLRDRNGKPMVVDVVRRRNEVTYVHNIEIEGLHTYFVSRLEVLSHNMCGPTRIFDDLGNAIPFGFKSADEFEQARRTLNNGLPPGTEAFFQGSSVTGKSARTGKPFDVGRVSDFDIALVNDDLFIQALELGPNAGARLKFSPDRIGPLSPAQIDALGLRGVQAQLTRQSGRPVNFMLFDNAGGARRRPSISALF